MPPATLTAATAAICARKSTDDDRADGDKSVDRQVTLARAYADARGWTVPDDLVFVDDGISATDWRNRAGWKALREAADAGKMTRVVVMEVSRISRDSTRGPHEIACVEDAGVEVWSYASNQQIGYDDETSEIMTTVTSLASSFERRRAKVRTAEAMLAKARAGHGTGGAAYGYRIVDQGSHKVWVVDPEEAEVVRRIFERCALGESFRVIADTLSKEKIPSPVGRYGRKGWSVTGIRDLVQNEKYVGRVICGKTRRVTRGGANIKVAGDPDRVIRLERPDLRIVSDGLWNAARARVKTTHTEYIVKARKRLPGRPERSLLAGKYLLIGFLACGVCAEPMIVEKTCKGPGKAYSYYVCSTNRTRGQTLCGNRHRVPVAKVTKVVVDTIRGTLLSWANVDMLVTMHREKLDQAAATRARLLAEAKKRAAELDKLLQALVANEDPNLAQAIGQAVSRKQGEINDLEAQIAAIDRDRDDAMAQDCDALKARIQASLEDTWALFDKTSALCEARQILRLLVRPPIVVTPRFPDTADDADPADPGDRFWDIGIAGLIDGALGVVIRPLGMLSAATSAQRPGYGAEGILYRLGPEGWEPTQAGEFRILRPGEAPDEAPDAGPEADADPVVVAGRAPFPAPPDRPAGARCAS